ncbi:hypothetical protein OIU79_013118 [Salix purpurea]|uniref:Uncharacterized protein n=1 Tax=Salix purpurea TaxID=77065 RepID=A0A9Q0T4B8_SALPP|nr:hypothetical protein OIU79_013118 [Salix purpurea]
MIRKCGFSAVESDIPEKHKSFFKTVLQNRHHKSSSKEADTNDIVKTPADVSPKRSPRTRNRVLYPRETAQCIPGRERGRGNTTRTLPPQAGLVYQLVMVVDVKGRKELGTSSMKNSIKVRSEDGWKKKNFNEEQTGGATRKMEHRNVNKKGKAAFSRPSSASKLHKPQKAWKKQKPNN